MFDDDFEKCMVRAELNGDPSTYDQITVKRLSERELKSYESFEKVNKTVFKIDTPPSQNEEPFCQRICL